MSFTVTKIVRRLAQLLTRITSIMEGVLFKSRSPEHPPIFIIGLPRSGSTLFYQCLCHSFHFAYSSKLVRRIWFFPALAGWWTVRMHAPYQSDFQSRYGKGKDWAMPYDATVMWNLWFDKDRHFDVHEAPPRALIESKAYIGRMETIAQQPYLERNFRCNQWLLPLAENFPTAVFLISMRNPTSVALSLLRSRIERFGNVWRWHLKLPRTPSPYTLNCPEDEVVYQVWGIIEDIRADMQIIGSERFACIHYDTFCESPQAYMEVTELFLKQHDISLKAKHSLPTSFSASVNRTDCLSEEQIENIHKAIARFFPNGDFNPLPCTQIVVNRDGQQ